MLLYKEKKKQKVERKTVRLEFFLEIPNHLIHYFVHFFSSVLIIFFVVVVVGTGRYKTYHRINLEQFPIFRSISNFLFILACALQFCRKWVVYNGVNVGMRWKRLYVQFRLAKGLTLRILNHQHPFRINSEYHLEHHQSIGKFQNDHIHFIPPLDR